MCRRTAAGEYYHDESVLGFQKKTWRGSAIAQGGVGEPQTKGRRPGLSSKGVVNSVPTGKFPWSVFFCADEFFNSQLETKFSQEL